MNIYIRSQQAMDSVLISCSIPEILLRQVSTVDLVCLAEVVLQTVQVSQPGWPFSAKMTTVWLEGGGGEGAREVGGRRASIRIIFWSMASPVLRPIAAPSAGLSLLPSRNGAATTLWLRGAQSRIFRSLHINYWTWVCLDSSSRVNHGLRRLSDHHVAVVWKPS